MGKNSTALSLSGFHEKKWVYGYCFFKKKHYCRKKMIRWEPHCYNTRYHEPIKTLISSDLIAGMHF